MIKSRIVPSQRLLGGGNRYHSKSMSLDFHSGFDPAVEHYAYKIDDLTLTIDPANRSVIGFDVFAPSQSWKVQPDLSTPPMSKNGLLVIDAEFDSNGIAGENHTVEIFCTEGRDVVKIAFSGAGQSACLAGFAQDCVCEIGADGSLVAIYMNHIVTTND